MLWDGLKKADSTWMVELLFGMQDQDTTLTTMTA